MKCGVKGGRYGVSLYKSVTGFAGQSVWRTLGLLGVMRNERWNLIRDMCKVAEDGSRWV